MGRKGWRGGGRGLRSFEGEVGGGSWEEWWERKGGMGWERRVRSPWKRRGENA